MGTFACVSNRTAGASSPSDAANNIRKLFEWRRPLCRDTASAAAVTPTERGGDPDTCEHARLRELCAKIWRKVTANLDVSHYIQPKK